MKRAKSRQFVADLWFVMAALTPVFTPVLLVESAPTVTCGALLGPFKALCQAMFAGPMALWFASLETQPTGFILLCAFPTLFVSIHALALRLLSAPPRELVRHGAWRFVVSMGGLFAAQAMIWWWMSEALGCSLSAWSVTSLGLWAGGLILYVVVASMWVASPKMRLYAFEMILGLILMEHLAIPIVSWLM